MNLDSISAWPSFNSACVRSTVFPRLPSTVAFATPEIVRFSESGNVRGDADRGDARPRASPASADSAPDRTGGGSDLDGARSPDRRRGAMSTLPTRRPLSRPWIVDVDVPTVSDERLSNATSDSFAASKTDCLCGRGGDPSLTDTLTSSRWWRWWRWWPSPSDDPSSSLKPGLSGSGGAVDAGVAKSTGVPAELAGDSGAGEMARKTVDVALRGVAKRAPDSTPATRRRSSPAAAPHASADGPPQSPGPMSATVAAAAATVARSSSICASSRAALELDAMAAAPRGSEDAGLPEDESFGSPGTMARAAGPRLRRDRRRTRARGRRPAERGCGRPRGPPRSPLVSTIVVGPGGMRRRCDRTAI